MVSAEEWLKITQFSKNELGGGERVRRLMCPWSQNLKKCNRCSQGSRTPLFRDHFLYFIILNVDFYLLFLGVAHGLMESSFAAFRVFGGIISWRRIELPWAYIGSGSLSHWTWKSLATATRIFLWVSNPQGETWDEVRQMRSLIGGMKRGLEGWG